MNEVKILLTWVKSLSPDVIEQILTICVNDGSPFSISLPPHIEEYELYVEENSKVYFSLVAFDGTNESDIVSKTILAPNLPPNPPTNFKVDWIEASFDLVLTKFERHVSSGTTVQEIIDKDAIYEETSDGSIYTEWDIDLENLVGIETHDFIFESLNPEIAKVDQNGYVWWVNDGLATIKVTCGNLVKYVECFVSKTHSNRTLKFLRWVNNSLAASMYKGIESRIEHKSYNSVYSQMRLSDGQPNPDCWINDIDISPLSLSGSCCYSGLLISPRHVLYSAHTRNGGGFSFRDRNGVVHGRSGVSFKEIGADMGISYLASELPDTVSIAKFLPSNWMEYLPNLRIGIPVAITNQDGHVAIGSLENLNSYVNVYSSEDPKFLPWWKNPRGGDSGRCVFAIDSYGMLIALTNWYAKPGGYSGDWTIGPNPTYWINLINNTMSELHGSDEYKLQFVDITKYARF